MKFRHDKLRKGFYSLGGHKRVPIDEDGYFEIPDDTNSETVARIKANHEYVPSEDEVEAVKAAAEAKAKVAKKEKEKFKADETKLKDEAESKEDAEDKGEEKAEDEKTVMPDKDLLISVNGIGDNFATQLLDKYTNLQGIVDAGANKVAKEIQGISKGQAEDVIEAIKKGPQ